MTRAFRVLRLALLLFSGLVLTLCLLPFCTKAARLRLKSSWAMALLDALGVELQASLAHLTPGVLIVSNHISWIDIYVINAVMPAAFVAKEEVRYWPILGWLAAKNDTIFLRRGSRGHAHTVNQQVAGLLARGQHVAVFPEGTTTDGCSLLHFHAALLQPALSCGRPVLPVAISYWDPEGERSLAPRYDGSISIGQCTRAIIGRKRTFARIVTTPLLGLNGESRKQVAAEAREAIAFAAELPLTSSPPERLGDLQGVERLSARPKGSLNQEPIDLA